MSSFHTNTKNEAESNWPNFWLNKISTFLKIQQDGSDVFQRTFIYYKNDDCDLQTEWPDA